MEKKEKDETSLPTIRETQDIFALFDQLDDQIILDELQNRVTDIWVYHFVIRGKDIWGIGKEGTDECVKEMAKTGMSLRDVEVLWRIDPTNAEYILFAAKVERVLCHEDGREVKVDSAIGTKRQRTMMVLKESGMLVENPFWFEQGSQKAIRNARLRLIPVEIRTRILEFAKQKKKVRKVEFKQEKKETKEDQSKPPPNKDLFPPMDDKELPDDLLSKDDKMKIMRLEATLTDKYKYSADKILKELESRFGVTNINKITSEQAQQVIYFLECTIDFAERIATGKERTG